MWFCSVLQNSTNRWVQLWRWASSSCGFLGGLRPIFFQTSVRKSYPCVLLFVWIVNKSLYFGAARLPTRKRGQDHITPLLASLHWLTGSSSRFYNLFLKHLKGWRQLTCPSRAQRSTHHMLLDVPRKKPKYKEVFLSYLVYYFQMFY